MPWHEGVEMFWRLVEAGVPAKQLIYNHASHTELAVAWYVAVACLRAVAYWQCTVGYGHGRQKTQT